MSGTDAWATSEHATHLCECLHGSKGYIWGSSDLPHSQNEFITVKFQNITDEKKMILKAFRENPGLRIVLTAGWIVEDYDGKP